MFPEQCSIVFDCLSVTPDQVLNLEKQTREEAKSNLWHKYRAGRVTASKFKQASLSDPANPSIALIKSICYPETIKFHSNATRFVKSEHLHIHGDKCSHLDGVWTMNQMQD